MKICSLCVSGKIYAGSEKVRGFYTIKIGTGKQANPIGCACASGNWAITRRVCTQTSEAEGLEDFSEIRV